MALRRLGMAGAMTPGQECPTCLGVRCPADRPKAPSGFGVRGVARQNLQGGGLDDSARRGCRVVSAAAKDESPSEALDRRLRESKRVEERVVEVSNKEEFEAEMKEAGKNLVVLEVNSDLVCESGLEEEMELQWELDKKRREGELWEKCKAVKHVFQRTARECPDIKFLMLNADTPETSKLCDELEINILPTLQFYKQGRLLWEHKGALHMQQDLGEGVLFYGDAAAGGEKASQHVREIHTREDLEDFLENTQSDNTLLVLDVSINTATPCVRMFPAVLALAKSFRGYASFARLLGDESPATQELMKNLGIVDVPTFLFFRNGKLLDRHVGSSRADLIGHILELQSIAGIPPPPPGGQAAKSTAASRRKQPSNVR